MAVKLIPVKLFTFHLYLQSVASMG